jgi:Sugar (and other) transporter
MVRRRRLVQELARLNFCVWVFVVVFVVAGSLSWRIPLGLQLLPGILLGLGTFALPASPRLLVLQGRREEALVSLAKLRLRPVSEARTDPLIQVRALKVFCIHPSDADVSKIELLEMEAEVMMLERTSPVGGSRPLRREALAWARLFDYRYIDRTLVGVMVMFFQRESRELFTST